MKRSKIELVPCNHCGGKPRNHSVIFEHEVHECDDYDDIQYWTHYQILKCNGCNAIRFRQFEECDGNLDEHGELVPHDVFVFPGDAGNKHELMEITALPNDIQKMYLETVRCFNSGANTLAGGGLRATVEAICRDRQIVDSNLEKRIDGLVKRGVLGPQQAELLHEERYIGNDALHEMITPSDRDIRDGLEIVEGVLQSIYVLPKRGDRLKQRRTPLCATESETKPRNSSCRTHEGKDTRN